MPTEPFADYHGHPKFYELLFEIAKLHSNKNHDYTDGVDPFLNFRFAEKLGIPAWKGVLVRLTDKFYRITNFAKRETLKVPSESFRDTLLDNAVYSLIALILFEEEQCQAAFVLQCPPATLQPSKRFSPNSLAATSAYTISPNDLPQTFPGAQPNVSRGSAVSPTNTETAGLEDQPPFARLPLR